jgi:manganese/zinc/iron transport system permease protein
MTLGALAFNIGLDLFPMLAGTLAAVVCGLLGNFLVLRRLSLMGDAISHSVLPGLVVAFMVTSSRHPLPMFVGAAAAGLVTVILVELIRSLGRVEPGAAMGVVFSVLFALGVLLIEQESARDVDLDAECMLHGQLETLVWYDAPDTLAGLLRPQSLAAVPRPVLVLAGMTLAALVFVGLLFKELRIAAFDPALASAQGFSAGLLHLMLMICVAAATVASFEAVGSILVIAMLVGPAATARLLTDRLPGQIVCSVVVALVCGIGGYLAASAVPAAFGARAVNAAGSIAVVAGGVLALAILLSPSQGVIPKLLRLRTLARRTAGDDLLAALYREQEAGRPLVSPRELPRPIAPRHLAHAIAKAQTLGLITRSSQGLGLTAAGLRAAQDLVRRHRLWEHYLVEHAGVLPDHVHQTAERLEHLSPTPPTGPALDPHGRAIPQAPGQTQPPSAVEPN